MYQGDLGDNALNQVDQICLSIQSGATVTVKVLAGSTLNYFNNLAGPATGTIAASSSQAFTTPTVLQSQGRSSLQITGTGY